jgi:transporter family-2 protein
MIAYDRTRTGVQSERSVRRMDLVLLGIAVLIGAIVGLQPAINARLGNFTGEAAVAALISTLTSSACLICYLLILRPELPSWGHLRTGPWWIWIGGIIGAVYVAVSLNLAQRLGATVLVAVVLIGQMLAALVIDHYGLLGLDQHTISPLRVLGVLLLIVGVILIRAF